MDKLKAEVMIGVDRVTVEVLAPGIARVLDPQTSHAVSEDDILRLTGGPPEAGALPQVAEILYKRNPAITEVEFTSGYDRDRMIALAAVLGAEVVDIEDIESALDIGTIRIAHRRN